jgi:hypothetical protein
MLAWASSGFSRDASVRIAGHDRAGLERLLRYCARPPFALPAADGPGGDLGALFYEAKERLEDAGGRMPKVGPSKGPLSLRAILAGCG